MKQRILTFILAILCLSSLACKSAASGESPETPNTDEAVEFDFDSKPKSDTLYTTQLFIKKIESNGFIGSSVTDHNVFVSDVETSEQRYEYEEYEKVNVVFYGRDISLVKSPVEVTLSDGCKLSYRYTIKKAVDISVADKRIYYEMALKPILYFYPEEETIISAKLELNGRLTCTYPEHGKDGWQNFVAKPDGTLIGPDGKEYYALYWEGETGTIYDFSKGFCVEGSRTAEFLADILPKLGLSAREANEFIIYWLPQMQNNAYNLISFQEEAYTDSAKLTLSPEPDTLIRIFMAWKGLETPVEIEPQTIVTPERVGFTVVEWGGSEISE